MNTATHILKGIVDDFGTQIPVYTLPYNVYMVRYTYYKGMP